MSILVESIRFNWRNTEDMEKEHLYEAFAAVLRTKIELVTPETVEQLLVLVGKLPNLPSEAVLSNTMAYRFLFLDFELWRRASRDIQKLVLHQFQDFTVGSRKRVFNAKRLGKLFLTKRLLMALRTEVFPQVLLPDVVQVIRSTLVASFNVDSVRAIATFIMSTLPQTPETSTQGSMDDWSRQRVASQMPSKPGSGVIAALGGGGEWQKRSRSASANVTHTSFMAGKGGSAELRLRRAATPGAEWDGAGDYFAAKRSRLPSTLGITNESTRSASRYEAYGPLSQLPSLVRNAEADEARFSMPQLVTEVRNLLLTCLVDILYCEPGNNAFASSFGQMITARWVLLFMDAKLNSQTVVLGTRLLAKLLSSQSASYVDRFRSSSQGFVIMGNLLPLHWNLLETHTTMLALAFGTDPTDIPDRSAFDLATLCSILKPDSHRTMPQLPEALTTSLAMLRELVHSMARQKTSAVVRLPSLSGWMSGGGHSEGEADERLGIMRDYLQVVETYCDLFEKLYATSNDIKALLAAPETIEQLLMIVFPVICKTAVLSPDAEISAMEGGSTIQAPVMPATSGDLAPPLMSSPQPSPDPGFSDLWDSHKIVAAPLSLIPESVDGVQDGQPQASSGAGLPEQVKVETLARSAIDKVTNFLVFLCVESVLGDWKPLSALENVMKGCPPAAPTDQKRFRAVFLSKVLESLLKIISTAKSSVLDPRIQSSMGKLGSYVVDKLFQGWFAEHDALTFDLLAATLETIEQAVSDAQASSRGAPRIDATVQGLYRSLNKTILFQLNEDRSDKKKLMALTSKCAYHQRVIFSPRNGDSEFYRCLISRLWKMLAGIDSDLQNESISVSVDNGVARCFIR